jgi:bacterioferritin-associated ferredoxin
MYVCLCKGLTEADVGRAAAALPPGRMTAEALIEALGLDDPNTCGRCARHADDLMGIALRACARARPSCAVVRALLRSAGAPETVPLPPSV